MNRIEVSGAFDRDGDFSVLGSCSGTRIEEYLRFHARTRFEWFLLRWGLGTPLTARVYRNVPRRGMYDTERVRLSSGEAAAELVRDTVLIEGDLNVSCSPVGVEVDVNSINLTFRPDDDRYTDQGLAWVFPGNPAVAQLVVAAQALERPGLAISILAEAFVAIERRVVGRLRQQS